MRKVALAIVSLAALVATSVAVAHGIGGTKTASAIAGTFSAAAGTVKTETCTTAAGKTIVVTQGSYTGSATGDAALTGAITLRARSVVNTTDGVGVVNGQLRIGNATKGSFTAVYDRGSIAGLAVGRSHKPSQALVANVSATFAPAAGFTTGKIGGGTIGGSAVEVAAAGCKASSGSKPERSAARGAISAISSASITVAGVTCAIPSDRAAELTAKYKVGDRVELACSYDGGAATLQHIQGKKHR